MTWTGFAWWKRLFRQRAVKPMTFGVGAAKTGTSSLAAVFEGSGIAAAHEPDCEELIELILARQSGRVSVKKFQSAVKSIIEAQALDANISQINGYIIGDLFAIFPQSKYIITVRDAESWVLSFLNHATTRPLEKDNVWHSFRALRFNRNLPYHLNDENLRIEGLQSLDSYLTYWMEHTLTVLDTVPESHLLMLSTANIEGELARIAEFIGLNGILSVENAHANKGSYLRQPLLDPEYLTERCNFFTALLLDSAKGMVSLQQWKVLADLVQPPRQFYYAQPVDQRIAGTETLRAKQATDIQRWRNVHTESDERWDGRARLAATLISDQPSVVDLGCGSMLIEQYLENGVRYVPIDVVRRDARTIVWDLNARPGRLPSEAEASCVVALGLLEYMHDIPTVLLNLAGRFGCVVCSYLPTDTTPSVEQRRATGWVSDYSIDELENAFAAAGLAIERKEIYRGKTHLWRLNSQSAVASY